jgi:hypothetical protein
LESWYEENPIVANNEEELPSSSLACDWPLVVVPVHVYVLEDDPRRSVLMGAISDPDQRPAVVSVAAISVPLVNHTDAPVTPMLLMADVDEVEAIALHVSTVPSYKTLPPPACADASLATNEL